MSHNQFYPRVVRPLAVAFAMALSLVLGVSMFAPAHAGEDFTPNSAVVNDVAGVTQDWFTVQGDGMYGYYWDAAGISGIPQGGRVYTTAGAPFTIYARHYTGTVKEVQVNVTNVAGVSAPNTLTLINPVCNPSTGVSSYEVTWNQTADGSGLESYRPFVTQVSDEGNRSFEQELRTPMTVADGQSIRFDQLSQYGAVGFSPGWHTVTPGEFTDMAGSGRISGTQVRLWVAKCGNFNPPAGQIPPGGVVVPPNDPNNPGTGNSAKPTGKLKFLARKGQVKAKAINRKVMNLSTFKLTRPGAKAIFIKAPAGKVVTARVKALKPGKYRLMAPVWKDGKVVGYECVDTLKLVRKR